MRLYYQFRNSSTVRQIGVWGLKNESVNAGEQLRLVCRMRGTPLPALQWFKDGAPIIVTSRLRIQYKKYVREYKYQVVSATEIH